jgi:shikimate kinase
VVYLKNSFAVCARRLKGCIDRPLFDSTNLAKTEKLFKGRRKLYDKAADITVNTGKISVLQAAKEVIKKVGIKVEKNKT